MMEGVELGDGQRPCKLIRLNETGSEDLDGSDSTSTPTTSELVDDEDSCSHSGRSSIEGLIERARRAQSVVQGYTQEQVDDLIKAVTWSCCEPGIAERIAKMCVEETCLGNYEGKLTKMAVKTRAALLDIINDQSVGIIERDFVNNVVKIAKPVGVIGCTSPSTNPEATPVIKAINALKGRNAIVISPHPRAARTNEFIVNRMRGALRQMGAPADLIIHVDGSNKAKTFELMQKCDLVWATGGSGIVRQAYSSGRPALGVGVGNAVIVVDDTADLRLAATNICKSKTFDYAASCSADNSVLAFSSIYEKLLDELVDAGAYVANEEEEKALGRILWNDVNGKKMLNPKAVVKKPQDICTMAGFSIPEDRKFVIVETFGVGPECPFSGEKLCPILALFRVDNLNDAIDLTNEIQSYQGHGHSCGIYSRSLDANVIRFASETKTARVLVNQPQSLSNSGSLSNGLPQTLSLGCGTWGGNSTTNNINWRQLVNVTWLSLPLDKPKQLPTDEELFGERIIELVSSGNK